jgi:hypothetical protein
MNPFGDTYTVDTGTSKNVKVKPRGIASFGLSSTMDTVDMLSPGPSAGSCTPTDVWDGSNTY